MDRLMNVTIMTGDVAGLQRYYEKGLGLAIREQNPYWVLFETAGATLSLCADPVQRGAQLQFVTDDIETRVGELADQGVACEPIAEFRWGKTALCTDPEGNRFSLWEPVGPYLAGAGLALSAAINCRDMEAMKRFYRDVLGFPTVIDSAWWVQLGVGEAGLGLHPRMDRPGAETHHGRAITIGFAVSDLRAWHEEAAGRGVRFTAPPSDRGYGTFADSVDPDGNPVTLRDVPESAARESVEERLAELYEDDAAPTRAAIRKPVRKGVKATSRVATRPQYRSAGATARRRRAGRPVSKVASPRGTGPAGTRQKPKRKHDSKRARAKPAIGRLKKAERRTFKSQKQEVASASKRRPVKRASRPRPAKRTVSRGAARR